MRVLRIAQDVFPEVVGGAPYHIHALSRDQVRRGHDVTVLTVSDDPDQPHRETRDGYTVVRTSPTVDLFGNKMFANTLAHLRDSEEYDVIHAHSHLFYSSNVAAAYRLVDDIPLAVTCHGLDSQRVPEWFSRTHLRTVGRLTYNAADVAFCYTEVERDRLREIGVTCPVDVIKNGIDTRRFSPTGDQADRIKKADGPTVLFVGRLVDGKRPQDLLKAFAEVRVELPDAKLFYCGDGPLRERLESSAVEEGMADNVVFLDHVPYERMPTVYRAADLLALTSRSEGLPRTVLEALACGKPVVSTQLEQIVPIVEKAGETVPVGDVNELAGALVELLRNPQLRSALGAIGRDIVTDKYDWTQTVEQTTEALKRLTDTGERSAPKNRLSAERKVTLSDDHSGGR